MKVCLIRKKEKVFLNGQLSQYWVDETLILHYFHFELHFDMISRQVFWQLIIQLVRSLHLTHVSHYITFNFISSISFSLISTIAYVISVVVYHVSAYHISLLDNHALHSSFTTSVNLLHNIMKNVWVQNWSSLFVGHHFAKNGSCMIAHFASPKFKLCILHI